MRPFEEGSCGRHRDDREAEREEQVDDGDGLHPSRESGTRIKHVFELATLVESLAMRPVTLIALLVGTISTLSIRGQAPSEGALDTAFHAFWSASSEGDREGAGRKIVAVGATFDEVAKRLKAGRAYGRQKTGRIELATRVGSVALDNVVEVPANYDPARAWPLRVSLHGGVGRQRPGPGEPPARPLNNRIASEGEIVLHPRAWFDSAWWTQDQVANLARLIDRVKHDYNVDESRIYVTGISDGGTGVYFLAMRYATPWAACVPLNGHPSVIANPDTGADGQLYSGNLANCPLRVVNGGRDRLYPAASVAPIIEMFKRTGATLQFQVYPEAGHDVSWWPEERSRFEAFLAAHPRLAHPEKISWETERTDRYSRFRWLVIDRLGTRASDVALEDVNTFSPIPIMERQLFDREKPSGRVDAARRGNAFDVRTRGVQAFTLLISPDVVDIEKPIRVTVNGRSVHDAIVKADVATLLKWAARDNDRAMTYGTELHVNVP
jgi:poly(3-hydroxybutyrate) depolymerase